MVQVMGGWDLGRGRAVSGIQHTNEGSGIAYVEKHQALGQSVMAFDDLSGNLLPPKQ